MNNSNMASNKETIAPFKTQRRVTIPDLPTDFCLQVGDESIPIHSSLLKSESEYFACLFESGMREVHNQTIVVQAFDVQTVKTVIGYIYGGETVIEWNNITEYFHVVECWQLLSLKEKLEEYIIPNVDLANVMDWFRAALTFNMQKLRAHVSSYVCGHFEAVSKSRCFLSLDFETLKDLLDDCSFNLSCDDKVQAGVHWILEKDKPDRSRFYKDILEATGLTKCSKGFVQFVLRSYALKESKPIFDTAILDILKHLEFNDDTQEQLVILGDQAQKYGPPKSVVQLDLNATSMEGIGVLPEIFEGVFAARCPTPYGMFSGGGGATLYEGSVVCALLDLPSLMYNSLPDLHVPVGNASAAFTMDYVYFLGGSRTASQIHRLDLQTLSWEFCTTMPWESYHPFVYATDTTLYMIRPGYCMYSYHTIMKTWKRIASSHVQNYPIYQDVGDGVVVGRDIYMFVGKDGDFARYDTEADKWTELEKTTPQYWPCCVVHLNGKIVLLSSVQPKIGVYDIDSKVWEESPLKTPYKLPNIFSMIVNQ